MSDMCDSSRPSRPICDTCLRPRRGCICAWITPLRPLAEVLVLQHPLESGNAKNSAGLLHLSLPGSTLVRGETFEANALRALLHGPLRGRAPACTLLLYPDSADPSLPAPPPAAKCDAAGTRLVVLDATWRKSRKMLYLNPALQALPRLQLEHLPPSRYLIRKAQAPGQLSTLEATCHALARLEGDSGSGRYGPLLDAFDRFVAQQAACVPA